MRIIAIIESSVYTTFEPEFLIFFMEENILFQMITIRSMLWESAQNQTASSIFCVSPGHTGCVDEKSMTIMRKLFP